MNRILYAILFLLFAASLCPAGEISDTSSNVKIFYLGDHSALWEEEREITLSQGVNDVELRKIPVSVDQSTIIIRPVEGPENFKVIEAGFSKIDSETGEKITDLIRKAKTMSSGVGPEPVKEKTDAFVPYKAAGVLHVRLVSSTEGKRKIKVLFKIMNFHVNPTYIAFLSDDDQKLMDIKGWASIYNNTGLDIENAAVYFPDEYSRNNDKSMVYDSYMVNMRKKEFFLDSPSFLIPTPVTLEMYSTVNYEFVSIPSLPYKEQVVIDISFTKSRTNISNNSRRQPIFSTNYIKVEPTNVFSLMSEDVPLPEKELPLADAYLSQTGAGRMLYAAGKLLFNSQENVYEIEVGRKDDIDCWKAHSDFRDMGTGLGVEETIEIGVQNYSTSKKNVVVRDFLSRSPDFEVLEQSRPYKLYGKDNIVFQVDLEPGGTEIITYKVHYEM